MLRRPVLRWVICGGELRLSYACRSNESADVTRVRRAPGAPLAASPSCRQPVGPGPAQARARHAGTPGPGGGVMMTHLRCTLQPHARRPRSPPAPGAACWALYSSRSRRFLFQTARRVQFAHLVLSSQVCPRPACAAKENDNEDIHQHTSDVPFRLIPSLRFLIMSRVIVFSSQTYFQTTPAV
jgi:hypothetical protein